MSAFVQSLLSSAFPNVKPPAPKARLATTAPAVAHAGPVLVETPVAVDATELDAREALTEALTEAFGSWEAVVTVAAVVIGTLWLFVVWNVVRRRRRARAARAAAVAQDDSARKLREEAVRTTVQEAVVERATAFEERFQRTLDERIEAKQSDDATLDAVQRTLDEKIKSLEASFEKSSDAKNKALQESFESTLNELQGTEVDFRKASDAKVKSLEDNFQATLNERINSLEETFQKTLDERLETLEEAVRRRVNQRLEVLESRIKLDQEAIEGLHKSISQRMEILEDGIRIIDGKQLDQEASHVTHRSLSVRLDTAESSIQALESKTRATSQRMEAVDDSTRVVDSRTKALSQRVEAVEDNLSTTDGQVTLLSHDASRGVDAIEKMQKHLKTLPGNERIRDLTMAWEERFNELESRMEQNQLALEDVRSEPEVALSWSHIESQEIEPTGPIYTRPSYGMVHSYNHSPTLSFDGSLPPTPSSSGRSYSFSSSNANAPLMTPTNSKRRRVDAAGFTDTTFASRQKLFSSSKIPSRSHSRHESLM